MLDKLLFFLPYTSSSWNACKMVKTVFFFTKPFVYPNVVFSFISFYSLRNIILAQKTNLSTRVYMKFPHVHIAVLTESEFHRISVLYEYTGNCIKNKNYLLRNIKPMKFVLDRKCLKFDLEFKIVFNSIYVIFQGRGENVWSTMDTTEYIGKRTCKHLCLNYPRLQTFTLPNRIMIYIWRFILL